MQSNEVRQTEMFGGHPAPSGIADMATRGGMVAKGRGAESRKGEDGKKPIIATLRGSLEFKAFLEMAAKKDRSSVADFLERAAVRYAKELGINEEPPER